MTGTTQKLECAKTGGGGKSEQTPNAWRLSLRSLLSPQGWPWVSRSLLFNVPPCSHADFSILGLLECSTQANGKASHLPIVQLIATGVNIFTLCTLYPHPPAQSLLVLYLFMCRVFVLFFLFILHTSSKLLPSDSDALSACGSWTWVWIAEY